MSCRRLQGLQNASTVGKKLIRHAAWKPLGLARGQGATGTPDLMMNKRKHEGRCSNHGSDNSGDTGNLRPSENMRLLLFFAEGSGR